MIIAGAIVPNQDNLLTFPLVDSSNTEVVGYGTGWTVQVSKAGGPFALGTGTKAEVGLGVYSYLLPAAEANLFGPLFIVITGVGLLQQNLEYVCGVRVVTAVEFTYTLTDDVFSLPISDAAVTFNVDSAGNRPVWTGITDIFGVARDEYGNLPRLQPGTYYVSRFHPGYKFVDPDTEVVS